MQPCGNNVTHQPSSISWYCYLRVTFDGLSKLSIQDSIYIMHSCYDALISMQMKSAHAYTLFMLNPFRVSIHINPSSVYHYLSPKNKWENHFCLFFLFLKIDCIWPSSPHHMTKYDPILIIQLHQGTSLCECPQLVQPHWQFQWNEPSCITPLQFINTSRLSQNCNLIGPFALGDMWLFPDNHTMWIVIEIHSLYLQYGDTSTLAHNHLWQWRRPCGNDGTGYCHIRFGMWWERILYQ